MPEIFTVFSTEVKKGTKVDAPENTPEAKKFEYINHFATTDTYLNKELGNMKTLMGNLNAKIKEARGIGKDIWGLDYKEAKLAGDHAQEDLNKIGQKFTAELRALNELYMARYEVGEEKDKNGKVVMDKNGKAKKKFSSTLETAPLAYDEKKAKLIEICINMPLNNYLAKGGRLDKMIAAVDKYNADEEKVMANVDKYDGDAELVRLALEKLNGTQKPENKVAKEGTGTGPNKDLRLQKQLGGEQNEGFGKGFYANK